MSLRSFAGSSVLVRSTRRARCGGTGHWTAASRAVERARRGHAQDLGRERWLRTEAIPFSIVAEGWRSA
jgi:hypothetical protein